MAKHFVNCGHFKIIILKYKYISIALQILFYSVILTFLWCPLTNLNPENSNKLRITCIYSFFEKPYQKVKSWWNDHNALCNTFCAISKFSMETSMTIMNIMIINLRTRCHSPGVTFWLGFHLKCTFEDTLKIQVQDVEFHHEKINNW